jgi:7,8-dihydropterin-6-yl-methyl-4-(beta-D-ribofuranosyl)aminobenzene 5'-phosphate synthase
MISNLSITILAENRVTNPRLTAEQGFSAFIETENGKILFDTGQTDAFIKNAKELNIDLHSVEKIVLSHGHYDHTGGLPYFLKAVKPVEVICHPALSNKKFKVYPKARKDIGIPWEQSDLVKSGAKFIFKSHQFEVLKDIFISGEIPRHSKYEDIDEAYQLKAKESFIHDEIHDDMCLVMNTEKGLVILLGCGHAGPINSVKHAMRIMGRDKVHAVIGGMHLLHSSMEKIKQIVHNLEILNPDFIVPLHCTGFQAINMMFNKFKDRVLLLNVGDVFKLES